MKRLTVYKQGKRVELSDNKIYVVYRDNKREVKNNIQIAYIQNFIKKRDIKHYDKYRMAFVLDKLNEYSENYNKTMKNKQILDVDKLFRILNSVNNGQKNAFYGQIDIKNGRKTVGSGFVTEKPLTEAQTEKLEMFINCKVDNKKSVYRYAPEITKSIVWIMKK